jgi:hypothetical protein
MRYRDDLPQLEGELFLTDGGLETTLIFHQGIDLPEFAAFDLLNSTEGTEILRRYYRPYLDIAREHGTGFVLESPTWRASPSWAAKLGYSEAQLDELNRKAIALMEEIRREEDDAAAERRPIVISGCIGPEGDGYSPDTLLSADEAQAYHRPQVETFADTAADMVNAMTITYPDDSDRLIRGGDPRRDLVHRRDGRAAPERPGAGGCDCGGGRGDGRWPRLLHDQLRPPAPLRVRHRDGRAVARADPGRALEFLDEEPRRARRGDGARRG